MSEEAGEPLGHTPTTSASDTPFRLYTPSFWGMVDDSPYWKSVIELYKKDNMQGAYELALSLGAGGGTGYMAASYRCIVAEYETQQRGLIRQLNDHLSVQYIPEETGEYIDSVCEIAEEVRESQMRRFGWDGKDPVLLTLLTADFEASWGQKGYGYCAPKDPYYKLCLPHSSVADMERFGVVYPHELAHVVSMSLSHARISNWVSEGFSTYASKDCRSSAVQLFLEQPHLWIPPERLDVVIVSEATEARRARWLAYEQAGWVVTYLAQLGGDESLRRLLADFADESIPHNLMVLMFSKSRTQDAVERIYGRSLDQLFREAYDALPRLAAAC